MHANATAKRLLVSLAWLLFVAAACDGEPAAPKENEAAADRRSIERLERAGATQGEAVCLLEELELANERGAVFRTFRGAIEATGSPCVRDSDRLASIAQATEVLVDEDLLDLARRPIIARLVTVDVERPKAQCLANALPLRNTRDAEAIVSLLRKITERTSVDAALRDFVQQRTLSQQRRNRLLACLD